MKTSKILNNKITVRPTDRKIKKGKACLEESGVLPKSLPIEKEIRIISRTEMLERLKDKLQIAIDNIRGR